MRNPRVSTRVRRIGAVGALTTVMCLAAMPAAVAEGPGYGGDASQLAVSWTPAAEVPSAMVVAPTGTDTAVASGSARGIGASVIVRATDPQLQPDSLALVVRGLGFRGKSKIEVRVGSDQTVVARADSAGALAVALDPAQVGGAQPGVSVMAVGRNQAGTEITLFGSIPPAADGSGPMSLVPWGVAAVAVAGLAVWMRRRHASLADGRADASPDATA